VEKGGGSDGSGSTCFVAKGDPFGREWKKGAEVTGADLPVPGARQANAVKFWIT